MSVSENEAVRWKGDSLNNDFVSTNEKKSMTFWMKGITDRGEWNYDCVDCIVFAWIYYIISDNSNTISNGSIWIWLYHNHLFSSLSVFVIKSVNSPWTTFEQSILQFPTFISRLCHWIVWNLPRITFCLSLSEIQMALRNIFYRRNGLRTTSFEFLSRSSYINTNQNEK